MAGEGGELTVTLLTNTVENVGENDKLDMKEKVWRESKKLWVVAAPAIFTRFSTSGVSLITQAFIGHLGPTELAAYSITLTVLLRFITAQSQEVLPLTIFIGHKCPMVTCHGHKGPMVTCQCHRLWDS
ncbi:unnamed protein product [Eruca vesicaria subsp. sativa]|uniref:Uncharacterized protein n=1 Tax=Eruca vesicaria subsp. sativa TaxID=29727 RepID=A0ABC8LFG3_ERUVS|nr:unnamed protein product [Eruca vesicaria subsp. sativa]